MLRVKESKRRARGGGEGRKEGRRVLTGTRARRIPGDPTTVFYRGIAVKRQTGRDKYASFNC